MTSHHDISVPGDRPDLRCARALRQIIRHVDLSSHRLAIEYGVSVTQLTALTRLVEHGPMILKRLASEIFLSPSTMVGVVDRLESKGLVRRARSDHDRRQVFIYTTPEGERLVTRSPSPLQNALAAALDDLGELERTTIVLSLERVVEMLDADQVDASPILETGLELESAQHEEEPEPPH